MRAISFGDTYQDESRRFIQQVCWRLRGIVKYMRPIFIEDF